jgi:NodT family efflux transporter outer membrane factor (OMF) lipoprotein
MAKSASPLFDRMDWIDMTHGHCKFPPAGLIGYLAFTLSACAVGPNYVRPTVQTPEDFKESKGWKSADPKDQLPRGKWWEVYGDKDLSALMDQVDVSNQNIKQAEAQYRAARALVQSARAAFFPTVSASGSATRSTSSAALVTSTVSTTTNSTGTSTTGTGTTGTGTGTQTGTSVGTLAGAGGTTSNLFTGALDVSWEIDIWGRLRRAAENAKENMKASAADLEGARLSAQAELAQDYFQLRILDEEKRLYDANVIGLEKSLKITQNQYKVGIAAQSDVAQAETQLKSTQASAIDLDIQRGQYEHAIAVLIGKPASDFSVPPAPLAVKIPDIPLDQPSDLLERRPDIGASERLVAAANANIGVAKAAYYPSLSLSGALGYENAALNGLFSLANRFWSVGPTLAETLFDGGARRAATDQAIANYDASVAVYRQTVLAAFQDTEDNLISLRVLANEITVQDEATKAADDSEAIALNQYKSGIVSYLNVVVAQTTALSNERASLTVRGRQLASSVALIKSLGGSWKST